MLARCSNVGVFNEEDGREGVASALGVDDIGMVKGGGWSVGR